MTRTITRQRTCEGLAHCAYWYEPDRDCGALTASHSAYCAKHSDQEDMPWWSGHDAEDCCPDCCKGEIEHE